MPLLKREPDVHPSGFFDLPEEAFPWWIVYVRSRQEKGLARYLLQTGIPFYLPQIEKKLRRSGRNFLSYHPLFSGYLFLRCGAERRADVWRSALLVNTIDVVDQRKLREELLQIHHLQQAGATLIPHPWIEPGDEVKITDGAFKGYKGVVMQERGTSRLIVSITTLRQSVAVEFEREMLAPADLRKAALRI